MADGNRNISSYRQRSSHVRSSSWSYTTGNRHINLSNLNPFTSVIREFVPTFGSPSRVPNSRSTSTSPLSPMSPTTYVDLSQALGFEREQGINRYGARIRNESGRLSSTNTNSGNSSDTEENAEQASPMAAGQTNNNSRSSGDRMEFQSTISWLERSLPFVLLLLSRIMWDHRLGIAIYCFIEFVTRDAIRKGVGRR